MTTQTRGRRSSTWSGRSPTGQESKRYRYYACLRAQKQGYDACPSPSIPAEEIERFVVDQIRVIGQDLALLATSVAEIAKRAEEDAQKLNHEARLLTSQIHAAYGELSQLAIQPGSEDRLATVQHEIDKHQKRLGEIRQQLEGLTTSQIASGAVEQAFAKFDPLWNAMSPLDQNDLLRLLIERVDYHGDAGEIELHLHPSGIQTLIAQTGDTP